MEQWRDVRGYEGYYQVSSYGRVRSLTHTVEQKTRGNKTSVHIMHGKIRKACISNKGYLSVNLYRREKEELKLVHRLVAEAFLDKPKECDCVNHKDEDKTNNRVENLEWCTHSYNNNYGNHNAKIGKGVLQYTIDGNLVKRWDTARGAAKGMGHPNSGVISQCCRGECNTAYGYKWSYE